MAEQTERLVNPFAPPAYNGVLSATPDGYVDVDFKIPYNVVLAADERKPNEARDVPTDADFIWRAIVANRSTGVYQVRFADSQGYFFSDGLIINLNLSTSAVQPGVLAKEVVIPAGGQIGIDIEDISSDPNTIQILFLGVKRYKIPK